MPLLLNIDTSTEVASVCVTLNGSPLATQENEVQKEHAAFVHTAINVLLEKTKYKLKDFEGFAVTSGPGSYTGLRVGLATAKGFCYALSRPLITINTLKVMTKAALDTNIDYPKDMFFCPMIDARRIEVFTAIYNANFESILSPRPLELEDESFISYIKNKKILFFGNGSKKFMKVNSNTNHLFAHIQHDASQLGSVADIAFRNKDFSDLFYSEPTYLKNFQSIHNK